MLLMFQRNVPPPKSGMGIGNESARIGALSEPTEARKRVKETDALVRAVW
jgi:hypothetical protein